MKLRIIINCLTHLRQQLCALATSTQEHTYTLTLAAVHHATIETALCADQEAASSRPVRGSHQEKMKAPRQEASSQYRPSVNSTQASVGQMRVEFGWRAVFEEGRLEVELKEMVCGPESSWPERKDDLPALSMTEEGCVCVVSVCIHTRLHDYMFLCADKGSSLK